MTKEETEERRKETLRKKVSGDRLVLKDERSLRGIPHVNSTMVRDHAGKVVTFDHVEDEESFLGIFVFEIKDDGGRWFWTLDMVDIL